MAKKGNLVKSKPSSTWVKSFVATLPFLILLITTNGLAFAFTANHPQCCDTEWYQSELSKINVLGFFPHGTVSWLSSEHNYIYTTFLYALSKIGLHGRSGVTLSQFAILSFFLCSVLVFMRVLYPSLQNRYFYLVITLGVFLNLNFTAYGLTEGLGSSLLAVYCLIFIMYYTNPLKNKWYVSQLVSLLILANVLWMLRPAFVWILLFTVLMVFTRALLSKTHKTTLVARELCLSILATCIVILPQFFIIKQRSFIDSLLHFKDIGVNQTFESSVIRYSTNVSGCGPRQLLFSPYSQDVQGIYPAHYLHSILPRFAGFIARIVSGWDGLPSSLKYLSNFSTFPGLEITLISGVIFVAPFALILVIFRNHGSWETTVQNLLLPALFIFSQIAMGLTHGEFRYNIAGWVIGFANLGVLIAHLKTRKDLKRYLSSGILCSFVFLTIGQLTLLTSYAWQACIK